MTTVNEATNGQSEAKSTDTSSSKDMTSKTKNTENQGQTGLVRAQGEDRGEVFILDDNTHIVSVDSLPNHRPIALSNLTVVGSLNMAGNRPIMADEIEVSSIDLLPGHRPVAVSTLPVSDLDFLPGNRPIASNDVVDPPASILMGYLD